VKNLQLENVLRNHFIGLEDMINGMKTYTVTAVCEKDAEVLYISYSDF